MRNQIRIPALACTLGRAAQPAQSAFTLIILLLRFQSMLRDRLTFSPGLLLQLNDTSGKEE